MTDRDIEQRLRSAIDNTAPMGLDRLLSDVDIRKGEKTMTNEKRTRRWIGLAAACLALVLLAGFGGFYYGHNYTVATTVSLDVNPSVQMEVSRAEKVISCAGLNDEGREILASMNGGADLKGAKLNVAVNAVVEAIVNAGYLDSLSSAILISVEDNDLARGERLQAQLVAEVDGILQTAANSAGVLSQYMTADKDLQAQAQSSSISNGKAALVNQVVALNLSLDFAKLAELSVEELRDLIRIGAPAMPIGKDAAALAAEEYAGVNVLDSYLAQYTEVDPELDDLTPHYDVELNYNGREYDYEIDAFTGEVLRGLSRIVVGNPGEPLPEGPALTADEAFNAAAAYFAANHPELTGNFLNIKTEYDRDDGHYDVEFWCSGCEFDYDVDGQTGAVLREETDYLCTLPTVPDTPAPETTPTTPTTPSTPAQTDIGADAAKAAALARAGLADDSSVTWLKCQREYDDGRLEYEIEFYAGTTEYDVTVLAADGTVLKYETERAKYSSGGGNAGSGQSGDVGADAARTAALAHAGLTESQVTRLKCERDYDDGRIEYEVSFKYNGYEYEYKLDAATGSILEHERDWDD